MPRYVALLRGINVGGRNKVAMITADAGLDKLDLWFDRALAAETVADIFKDDED
jgi:uncharacterized protein (DUF1697 family)